jgi:hypothetical protein
MTSQSWKEMFILLTGETPVLTVQAPSDISVNAQAYAQGISLLEHAVPDSPPGY